MPKYIILDTATNRTYLSISDLFPRDSFERTSTPEFGELNPVFHRVSFTLPGCPRETRNYPFSWTNSQIETHLRESILDSIKNGVYIRFRHYHLTSTISASGK